MRSLARIAALSLVALSAASARADAPVKKALVVVAHPDDETMIGGTLGRMRELGIEVHAIYATQGEGGKIWERKAGAWSSAAPSSKAFLATRRGKELKDALRWYGVKQYLVMDQPDAAVRDAQGKPTRDVRKFLDEGLWDRRGVERAIEGYAKTLQPDIVITMLPDNGDVHAHHQAIARITRDLHRQGRLGDKVQQLYGMEENAWYPESSFAGHVGDKARLALGQAGGKLGMSYGKFAITGARMHASQNVGYPAAAPGHEQLIALGESTHDPLGTLLHGAGAAPRGKLAPLRMAVTRVGLRVKNALSRVTRIGPVKAPRR